MKSWFVSFIVQVIVTVIVSLFSIAKEREAIKADVDTRVRHSEERTKKSFLDTLRLYDGGEDGRRRIFRDTAPNPIGAPAEMGKPDSIGSPGPDSSSAVGGASGGVALRTESEL